MPKPENPGSQGQGQGSQTEHTNKGRSDEAQNREVDPETGEKPGVGPRGGHKEHTETVTDVEDTSAQ